VVVGGITLAPLLILLVLPVLIEIFSTQGRTNRRGAADEGRETEGAAA
jgi:Cu/Ag efflux pump CusA